MAKDSSVKNGERTFNILSDEPTQNGSKRQVRCQNCFHIWETVLHPNAITECPNCKEENSATRRIIFYYNLVDLSISKE